MCERVAVVGGGIAGVAHAWRHAVRGCAVTLFERSPRAEGASVRNFGMVWPIGQPEERLDAAFSSRGLWDEFVAETGVWTNPAGSLFVANREDEQGVLEEFQSLAAGIGYRCRLLSPSEAVRLCPAVDLPTLRCATHSTTELGVDPRECLRIAPAWLTERHGVEVRHETTVVDVDLPVVRTADGASWEFDRVIVASGADFGTLYPELFAEHSLKKCKLQMMRTTSQPGGWRLGPMVASGLTQRHYPTFAVCPALDALKRRVAEETPELDEFGIHVMAAQNGLGEVVLGDSHEYGDAVGPFDNDRITDLMLRELHKVVRLPDWGLSSRWHGVYAVQPSGDAHFVASPSPGVTVAVLTGGVGMTLAFGLAERLAAGFAPVPMQSTGSPA